jgi:hypothetical protein
MAFQFPSNPTLNQTYTYNSITWTYNGRGWSRSTFGTSSPVITVTPANVSDQANTSTGYFSIPKGSTAERPGTPSTGMVRYNSTLNIVEQYNGTTWAAVGGEPPVITPASVSDQVNTSTGYFDLPMGTTAQRPASPANGYTRVNTTTSALEMYYAGTWATIKSVGISSATGGTVTTSGNFNIHTFTSSGNFTVSQAGASFDILMVAGGGGGGGSTGGGGGAGGLIYTTGVTLTESTYALVVGAGGAAGPNQGAAGDGSNSTGFSLIAVGGGKGAFSNPSTFGLAGNGGSGGGAQMYEGRGNVTPGLGTSGQGNNGGAGFNGAVNGTAGGGGGAGVAGSAGTAAGGTGNGGNGLSIDITGTATYYAGGGGAGSGGVVGTGGLGGGGAGWNGSYGLPGTVNTGGGGGGGWNYSGGSGGGAGGSGIIIVRYRYQ